jgi:hypothetical protein
VKTKSMTHSDKQQLHSLPSAIRTAAWFAILTGPAAVAAYYRIFSGFSEWDDEGTVMMMVRQFLTGSKLYQEVFSGYGPVYFFFNWLIRTATGTVLDHNAARITSAVVAVICPLLCAWIVLRLTRSMAAATVAHLLVFRGLLFFTNEPGHPQELCMLLVICLAGGGILAANPWHRDLPLSVAGAAAAALTLVKVNLGIFAVLAIALTVLFRPGRGWFWRAAKYATACGALLLPFVLMRVQLTDPGAQAYCLVVTASIGGVLAGANVFGRRSEFSVRDCVVAAAGFAITFVLAMLILVLQGVTMAATFNALIMNQVRMNVSPGFWYVALDMSRVWFVWAMAGLGAAILVTGAMRVGEEGVYRRLAPFQVLFGAAGLLVAAVAPSVLLGFVAPFCWLLLCPEADEKPSVQVQARMLLCATALLQTLIAYPMPGSQAYFLRVLLMVVVTVVLFDGLAALRRSHRFQGVFRRITRPAAAVTLAAVALAYPVLAYRAKSAYEAFTPLNLPGAGRIHLEKEVAGDLQWLVANLRQHCDTFVGLPGLPSLYFWTGKPLPGRVDEPPGPLNMDQWMDLFTPAQQAAIAADFSQHPNGCAIYHPSGVDFWNTSHRDVRSWTLANYILTNFKTIGESGDYQFMIRKERQLEIPSGSRRAPVPPRRR